MAGRRNPTRSRTKPAGVTGNDAYSGDDRSARIERPRSQRREDQSLISVMNVNITTLLGFGIVTSFVAVLVIFQLVSTVEVPGTPRVVTPFPAPKLTDLPMFQGDHKESLYWGTYRPTVYFGMRARTPRSLITGLMWLGVTNGRYSMRHVCENSDELKRYGWTEHNGRDYGRQVLADQEMTLTTSFLKAKDQGSSYGGDWAVRIGVENNESVLDKEVSQAVHMFFYVADEDGNPLSLGGGAGDSDDGSILASGDRIDIGSWQLHINSEDEYEFHHAGFRTPFVHNLSDLVQANLGAQARKVGRLQLSDTSADSSNILVFQISAEIPFSAEIIFLSGTLAQQERALSLSGASLTRRLNEKQKEYAEKFQRSFTLSDELDSESVTVGKAALGNLLGGIGYFYGQSKISLADHNGVKDGDNFISYWPAELYTAVPSRPIFPRGFLWDEGFHQLLIWRWDIQICLDILGHWLDLMNVDGWIPREQILGAEALSKVPEEFVLQYPSNGNPPTLYLVLSELICSMKTNKFTAAEKDGISLFLDRAFVRLEAWFKWFNTTQSGKATGSYFWHGRDNTTIRELNPKTLSSGLDDYPRASHPSEDERHLDLRCWMHLAVDCLHSITELLGKESEHGKEYKSTAMQLSDFDLLNQMHFDDGCGAYFDYGYHTEKVQLSWKVVEGVNNHPIRELRREVLEKPVLRLVPHFGYVSLFPLMGRLIPPGSWVLEKQLDLISNRSTLWTKFGLRSLSKTSSIYMKYNTEHDPPYWRGSIWMNMNYMVLSALHHYSREDGPYRERAETMYNKLRNNLIRNVVDNYHNTGYIWEQYDQMKGKGKGVRPFTGWTSLVVLIMAEQYHEC